VIVTNQVGIARGYYTESAFLALTRWMLGEFAKQRVRVAGVYHCHIIPSTA
jgi:D-glycero-D-manno-heptose 1,7-bisphosphate phosphatase